MRHGWTGAELPGRAGEAQRHELSGLAQTDEAELPAVPARRGVRSRRGKVAGARRVRGRVVDSCAGRKNGWWWPDEDERETMGFYIF